MFLGSRFLVTSALTVGLTSAASAQESVGSAKVATKLPDLVSSQTGNVELRNYTYEKHKEGDVSKRDTLNGLTQVRTNLTVKTFKDKVATTLTLGAMTGPAAPESKTIVQRRPRLLTEVTAVDSKFFSLKPYADIHGPQTAPGTRADLGLKPELKHPAIVTALGDLNFGFNIEAEGQFESRRKDAKQRTSATEERQGQFGLLDDNKKLKTREDDRGPLYEVMYVPSVALNMERIAKGLTLYSYVEYTNTYEPVVEITDNGSNNPDRETVYEATRDTTTYLGVNYNFSPTLAFFNEFSFGHSGLYQARGDRDRNRVTNVAMLAYKMY